jgi:hypothetical protein
VSIFFIALTIEISGGCKPSAAFSCYEKFIQFYALLSFAKLRSGPDSSVLSLR